MALFQEAIPHLKFKSSLIWSACENRNILGYLLNNEMTETDLFAVLFDDAAKDYAHTAYGFAVSGRTWCFLDSQDTRAPKGSLQPHTYFLWTNNLRAGLGHNDSKYIS